MRSYLFKVFGTRVFFGYGVVALLTVSILAALDLASQYGLHLYVTDQLQRIPWDISLVHRGEPHRFKELQQGYAKIPEVHSSEMVGFVRMRNFSPFQVEINGNFPVLRWVAFIAATKPELLPAEFRGLHTQLEDGADQNLSSSIKAVTLVGTRQSVSQGDVVRVNYLFEEQAGGGHVHGHAQENEKLSPRLLFEDRVMRAPGRMERQEFNKWMLREIGSLSYLPDDAMVFLVSMEVFEDLARRCHTFYVAGEGMHEGETAPPYVPEVTHLISIKRDAVVSSWDLEGSLRRLASPVQELFQIGRQLTPQSYVSSDLFLVLGRMNSLARLVSLATLLIAIPFLWMSWVLARTLGRLLILNERRLIGLALVRGIPIEDIGRCLLLALLLGGVGGGVLGLIAGTGLPLLAYGLAGYSTPPANVLLREMVYFALFLGLGILMAVFAGRQVLKYVRQLTPREAVARVEAAEESTFLVKFSWLFVFTYLGALFIGGYKIVTWISGRSLLLAVSQHMQWQDAERVFWIVENLLNFLALPLFLFGLAGLVMWKMDWVQKGLSALTAPLVGDLGWFVSRHMTLGRHRIANLFFVAALAMSLSLLPQIAADGFYGRILRGVKASIGGDLLLEFDAARLIGGQLETRSILEYQQRLRPQWNSIRNVIETQEGIAAVEMIEQFLIPGIFMPGQSGLALNVIQNPAKYLQVIYYEDQLGITRAFSNIIRSLGNGSVSASQGLFQIRSIPRSDEAVLDYWSNGALVHVPLKDVIAFLPGQPALGIQNREGFVTAEINYLNYLQRSEARIVVADNQAHGPLLRELEVVPSRVVFVAKSKEGVDREELAKKITAALPFAAEDVRWEGVERKRLSKDMFLSLALENMKVYMLGGLVLALASVGAIALVNFATDRRTFALLRLRGVPLPILLRIAISIFLIPVVGGILIGIVLGAVSGYGISQVVWELPRVYGVGGSLSNHLIFSNSAWAIVLGLSLVFSVIALSFGLWLFRKTAHEAIRDR
ncbi:MAG: ABC transporter permease [Acidobacteria bacterium]|nr:ABC transporter permease [Acidobacteriota bacterium]